jgi:hypothetical protein
MTRGQWKDASNFGRHDLLDLAEAVREAATNSRSSEDQRPGPGPLDNRKTTVRGCRSDPAALCLSYS